MAISEEERKAYEAGQRERRLQDAPLAYLLSPSERPSDPELQRAFDKGLRGEQLDEDKKSSGFW